MGSARDPRDRPTPPRAAVVTPRGRIDPAGEVLPVLDLLEPWLSAGARGAIRLAGPSGSGKSVALGTLLSFLRNRPGVVLLDEPSPAAVAARAERALVVFASARPLVVDVLATIQMAPWGDDDAIEYLLAAHHDRHASVMRRVLADEDRSRVLAGLPELWRTVLDEMAVDEGVTDVLGALGRAIDRLTPTPVARERVAELAWQRVMPRQAGEADPSLAADERLSTLLRLLRHRPVAVLLAAEHVVRRLDTEEGRTLLATGLPRDLIPEVAQRARSVPSAVRALARVVTSLPRDAHPVAASLLFAIDPTWRPPGPPPPRLAGAHLAGARWQGIDLRGADLTRADLKASDLTRANLAGALLLRAHLGRSRLAGANLALAKADEADLRHADLRGARMDGASLAFAALQGADLSEALLAGARLVLARLDGATLARANLTGATLCRARLEDADLTGADLTHVEASDTVFWSVRLAGADFSKARLRRCDFEGVGIERARFAGADLSGADLSDSVLPGADLRGALLVGAGLAGVAWEGADLRDADFSQASFHLGSSRSGLLHSPIASEGTRTGFYTDESAEQAFRPPEEIRKANLRGADLRGAKVEGTDWYLVDLRDTRHTPAQRAHFVRCRAILHDGARPGA